MGNKHNKLERKFSSLPPQSFPSRHNSLPTRGKKGGRRRKQSKTEISFTLQQNGQVNPQEADLSVVNGLFLPEYPDHIHDSIVNENHFQIDCVIAKGAFGNVFKVHRIRDGIVYAMKVMQKSKILMEAAVQQCKHEASIANHVGYHSFIVKPHWFFQNNNNIFMVMEYIPRGELFEAWKRFGCFCESLVRLYVAELAMVLDFLHNEGIIYRDLKLENILLDAQGHLQVIDFGLAKWLPKGKRTGTICGTLQYIAPEVVSLKPYSHEADWWSLGILMYALLMGEYPVNGARSHHEMAYYMSQHTYELPHQFPFSWEVRDCVQKLLTRNPKNRIGNLEGLLQQAFFIDLNFEQVIKKEISPNMFLENPEQYSFDDEPMKKSKSFGNGLLDQGNYSFDKFDYEAPTQQHQQQSNLGFTWSQSVKSLDGMYV